MHFLAGVLITACAITGCSTPQERHKVLTFFFDGVPDPADALAEDDDGTVSKSDLKRRRAQATGYAHKPIAEKNCEVCHGISREKIRARGFSGATMDLIRLARKACSGCHSDPESVGQKAQVIKETEWLHGPVALGRCQDCHRVHEFSQQSLLVSQELEEVCLSCHTTLPERTGAMAEMGCRVCHDPHSAPRASDTLLRGGREGNCAKCHPLDVERRPWLHGPVARSECQQCHSGHGGEGYENHVRRPIREACTKCHLASDIPADCSPTAPAAECDTCHDPHAATSAADLLLRDRVLRSDSIRSAFGATKEPTPDLQGDAADDDATATEADASTDAATDANAASAEASDEQ